MTTIDVRRAEDRTYQRLDGIHSRFSFAFAGNFDLAKGAHGTLMALNDDVLDARFGLDPHAHANAEIVTWVVEGRVRHTDSTGHTGEISEGQIQRFSAGRGIRHSEENPDPARKLRVVQMWLAPDTRDVEPSYAQTDLGERLATGELVTALSGLPDTDPGVGIRNRWSALDIARPVAGRPLVVAGAPFHHLFVTRGSVRVSLEDTEDDTEDSSYSETLRHGDALRLTDASGVLVEAVGEEPAEFLVWRMHAHF